MPVPIIELVGWVLWEFIFAIIFYNSGSALIRLVSFGKIKFPILSPSSFQKEKPLIKNASICYLVGMIFYMSLIVIWVIVNS